MRDQRPLRLVGGGVRASGEELRGLGDRRVAVVGRGDPPQAVSDRGGVDDADAPAVLARQRRPVQVESPAGAQRRERQQRVERGVVKPDDRADLDEPRLADDGLRPAAGDLPGGVRVRPMGRLGETQVKALGQEHERVEEAARQRHVVVDHQQPVVALRPGARPAAR